MERYYIDLNKCLGEDFSEYEFDDQGIPLNHLYPASGGSYNPITVCQYGLFHFNKFVDSGDSSARTTFLAQANWLIQSARPGANDSSVWPYHFDLPFYNITAPWISGMAQGEALSVLVRAFSLSQDHAYLAVAHNAWNIFAVNVGQGGVMSGFPDGSPLVEEYPTPGHVTAVLNGFIFAIFGVYDYWKFTGNEDAGQLYRQLIQSLAANLHRYDSGYWSYYELKSPKRLASRSYHRLHLEQLQKLYDIAPEPQFAHYLNRFSVYQESTRCKIRWTIHKLGQKIFWRV
ncbi:MAG: D-glucuronyl C5-epimerase family protein [Candidatus Zhuqueibacterota bacterium]